MASGQIARSTLFTLLLGGTLAGPAVAQPAQCTPGQMLGFPEVVIQIEARAAEIATRMYGDQPRTAPESEQISAPSNSGTSTSLVEGATFPSILALALDRDLVGSREGALTLNVSPFAIVTAKDLSIIDEPGLYNAPLYDQLRRWGVTAAFGGKGDAFDRNGDGEADEALDATEMDDIVTWEVRYRLYGTRDRKDRRSLKTLLDQLGEFFESDDEAWNNFVEGTKDAFPSIADAAGEISCEGLEKLLADPVREKDLLDIASSKQTIEAAAAAWDAIDDSPVVTLVAGGVEREPEFGPNERLYALRASWKSHTLNLEFSTEDGLAGAEDPETWKLSYELSSLWWKGRWPGGEDGVEASIGATYETFDHVPNAKHDTNAKAGVKLEFPVREGVKVPLSVTWVNHKDLLSDEDEVVGHFGISFDASGLLGKAGGS